MKELVDERNKNKSHQSFLEKNENLKKDLTEALDKNERLENVNRTLLNEVNARKEKIKFNLVSKKPTIQVKSIESLTVSQPEKQEENSMSVGLEKKSNDEEVAYLRGREKFLTEIIENLTKDNLALEEFKKKVENVIEENEFLK